MERNRIFKYPLKITGEQKVMAPAGAVPLCVKLQRGAPCLWALVDEDLPNRPMTISTYGTGHLVDDDAGHYLGTVLMDDGTVWHFFTTAARPP